MPLKTENLRGRGISVSSPDRSLIPDKEPERLAALRRYEIPETPESVFDRVTRLAAHLFDAPIAIVSIVERERIWFTSHRGTDAAETARAPGLCASAILQEEPWIVSDAAVDPRTTDNPLVHRELGVRFYAGVPLRMRDGHALGMLAVLDQEPREVTDKELAPLEDLAAMLVNDLELRLLAREQEQRLARGDGGAEFLVTASHELRTPLAAVYGAAKLLSKPGL